MPRRLRIALEAPPVFLGPDDAGHHLAEALGRLGACFPVSLGDALAFTGRKSQAAFSGLVTS